MLTNKKFVFLIKEKTSVGKNMYEGVLQVDGMSLGHCWAVLSVGSCMWVKQVHKVEGRMDFWSECPWWVLSMKENLKFLEAGDTGKSEVF